MLTLKKSFVALGLSLCILFVTGGLAYTSPLHSPPGHHDQQTHEKTWCSWTCQAGQGIQALSPYIPRSWSLLGFLVVVQLEVPALLLKRRYSSRAPPGHSFA